MLLVLVRQPEDSTHIHAHAHREITPQDRNFLTIYSLSGVILLASYKARITGDRQNAADPGEVVKSILPQKYHIISNWLVRMN